LKDEIARLEVEVDELKRNAPSRTTTQKEEELHEGSEKVDSVQSASDDEDDEEEVKSLPSAKAAPKRNMKHRSSVSAEAYGVWNQKEEFKANVVLKPERTKDRIRDKLNQAFMFKALGENEKNIVIDAMDERKFEPGQYVIKQGDEGAEMFMIEKGELDCTKLFPGNEDITFLKTYQPGESFGELALLYNAPRAANIMARSQSTLWALDRDTFNHIVKDAASIKRQKYEDFLSKVNILQTMDAYERSKLADAFKEEAFETNQVIIQEGDEGSCFYFI
jgi:cAMP-dependent protein kinase regulator